MAWSIFDYPNGNALATVWAVELLSALGIQATPDKLQFIFDWEKSEGGGGKFNPLNQGPVPGQPQLTTTGQQFGGGAADFASWQAGIQGAVAYLNMPNYQPILQQLRSGNGQGAKLALWNSPWAASHYGYGSNWSTAPYTPMSPAEIAGMAQSVGLSGNIVSVGSTGTGNPTGGNVTSAPGNAINGQPLSMADIPAVVAWIKQNWGGYAWLLNEPGLAPVLEKAAVEGLSADQVQALIEQTPWWKTTSAAMRQYEQDRAMNPADYNFNTPGSKAAQMYAQIANAAAGFGVMLSPTQIQQLASQALQFGWTNQQIQMYVGKDATTSNAQQVVQQLNTIANSYFQTLSHQNQQLWASQVAGGLRTLPEFQAQMAQQAAGQWTGYAQQLLNGYTMTQLTDNLRQEAAKTMEVDPNSINFTNDPLYSRIVDFAPPTPAGATQLPQHRVMTLSEMDQFLKSTRQWDFTQNARDQAATMAQTIAENFGRIPGATM